MADTQPLTLGDVGGGGGRPDYPGATPEEESWWAGTHGGIIVLVAIALAAAVTAAVLGGVYGQHNTDKNNDILRSITNATHVLCAKIDELTGDVFDLDTKLDTIIAMMSINHAQVIANQEQLLDDSLNIMACLSDIKHLLTGTNESSECAGQVDMTPFNLFRFWFFQGEELFTTSGQFDFVSSVADPYIIVSPEREITLSNGPSRIKGKEPVDPVYLDGAFQGVSTFDPTGLYEPVSDRTIVLLPNVTFLTSEVDTPEILAPPEIAGTYFEQAGRALYGPTDYDVTGNTLFAEPMDGCAPLTNAASMSGKICVVDRGTCPFSDKTTNCELAGAVGTFVLNNDPDTSPMELLPAGPGVWTIPTQMLHYPAVASVRPVLLNQSGVVRLTSVPFVPATSRINIRISAVADYETSDDFLSIDLFTPTTLAGFVDFSKVAVHWDDMGRAMLVVTAQFFQGFGLDKFSYETFNGTYIGAWDYNDLLAGTTTLLWETITPSVAFLYPIQTRLTQPSYTAPQFLVGMTGGFWRCGNPTGHTPEGLEELEEHRAAPGHDADRRRMVFTEPPPAVSPSLKLFTATYDGLGTDQDLAFPDGDMTFYQCQDWLPQDLCPFIGARQDDPFGVRLATQSGVVHNGVYHDDSIFVSVTHNISAEQYAVRWFELDTTNPAAVTFAQIGDIVPDAQTDTYISHIDCDAEKNVGIAMLVAGSDRFPSVGHTGRLAGDPSGTMRPLEIAVPGAGPYFGGSESRQGDYIGMQLDPADGKTFRVHAHVPRDASFINFGGIYSDQYQTTKYEFRLNENQCPPVGNAASAVAPQNTKVPPAEAHGAVEAAIAGSRRHDTM